MSGTRSSRGRSAAGPLATRRRVRALAARLERAHGPFLVRAETRDPVDQLVQTILSQATSDRNSERAFASLKRSFPTWQAVLSAPVGRLETAIRVGGLSRTKSQTIVAVLEALRGSDGAPSLAHVEAMPVDAAIESLRALPGVGLKTACCVLLFAWGRPAMPVDTHVHRLSRRLGLVAHRASADQAHVVLQALTPPELVLPLHLGLVRHGRRVCGARAQRCAGCALADLCPSARRAPGGAVR